jgi:hypothetical protein
MYSCIYIIYIIYICVCVSLSSASVVIVLHITLHTPIHPADGKTYLKAVMDKHASSLGLLASSVGSISSYEKKAAAGASTSGAIRENGFCFNDIRDVEEFVIAQNALLFRLDREERLKVSGLSLLKTTEVDDDQQNDDDDGE